MALATASTPPSLPDPLRLRRRLGLQGVAFGLLLLTVFAASLYGGIAAERRQNLRLEAGRLAASAASQLPLISHELAEVGNARKFRNDREVVVQGDPRRQRVQWFDAAGRLLVQEGRLPLPAAATPAASSAAHSSANAPAAASGRWQQWPGGISLLQPVLTRPRDQRAGAPQLAGFVRVGLSTAPVELELARLRRGLLLGGVTTVIVALMVGRRLLRQAFLPLQRQVEALERFSADASHELRHPLTLLRTLLAAEPAPLSPLLARVDAIAASMAALLGDLLFLARQEQRLTPGGLPGEGWCRFDLLELLEDQLAGCAPLARAAGVALELRPPLECRELPVRGQPDQLQRLITNLLLNAIRFSPPAATVRLAADRQAGRLRITVADQGPGIAPRHRQAIFERFWSLDPGATAAAGPRGQAGGGHSGLGLPIARSIARRHGGDLTLLAAAPGHCVFLVDLPAA